MLRALNFRSEDMSLFSTRSTVTPHYWKALPLGRTDGPHDLIDENEPLKKLVIIVRIDRNTDEKSSLAR